MMMPPSSSCVARKPAPIEARLAVVRRLFLVGVLLFAPAAFAAELPFDLQRSVIRIHVGKAGLFSAAGHEHWVRAPISAGIIDDAEPGRVAFTVQAAQLAIEPDNTLKPEQQLEVQRSMQEKVLESAQYPEISFRSRSVRKTGADTWLVAGDLSLHGQTRPISLSVRKAENVYAGTCRFKQSAFGIHPISVGGVVKVKDEVEILFSILAATPQ